MKQNRADNPKLKAQSFKARFLEAGIVAYEDETVLIKNENVLKIAETFKGAHVIIDHQDVSAEDADSKIVGYITNVWLESDGWAWCDFTVNSEEAINLINKGYSVSSCYMPEYGQGGIYHNVSYDHEIIGGEGIHLAIVANPRYEDAIILKNSINKINKIMTIFKFKKDKKENAAEVKEIELENAMFEIEEGVNVSVSDMVESYQNSKKNEEEEKKKEEAKVNSDSEFEIDGEMVKVSELAAAYKAAQKKNAEDEDEKKAKEDEAKKNEEDEKEKEKEEVKKNSADAAKIDSNKKKFENGAPDNNQPQLHTAQRSLDLAKMAFGKPQEIKQ